MTRGEAKTLRFENQAISTLRNNKKRDQDKPIGLNSSQSSALSPQSFNLSTHSFEQICTELLRKGHHVKFRAPGDSMYPTICDGDLITVEQRKASDVCVGDIILYHHKNGVVAHRVVDIKAPQSSDLSPQHLFFLRGDAALVFDAPVSADHILGKVTLVEREGCRIDPYSFKATSHFKTRQFGSRIKRLLLRLISRSA